jgi:excinuclease ABC subunit A
MAADYVVDMGPGAGVQGGQVVASGTPRQIQSNRNSLTGRYLCGAEAISAPTGRRIGSEFLEIKDARAHNLKISRLGFPLAR